ncbi:TrkH family potassium uptake protein [Paramicrobacterium chengjingii]|uniref:TrkH family potassium uptake protein n=1 Tax=Paramicrobacterium chengjingii TaxID=2769067 RepID=A0ABX6YJ85_9MICO|nr:potassium transporter TrkG [Microbacterium chengjingii]QPZ38811.1 TrkH family potassium uptake protein [Microbacterium chengjingii]
MARRRRASASPLSRTALGRLRETVNDFTTRSPSRFAILVFGSLIVLFTFLFSLPAASASRTWTPLADAFFTAMSTICVTGLSTVNMATHWSLFGDILVVLGVQIGAVGVLTLASILGMVISRRLGLRAKLVAASDSNPLRVHHGPVAEGQAVRLGDIGSLLLTVVVSLLVIEAGLAVLLFARMLLDGIAAGEAALHSIYYSAMAFTNTGFTPNELGLERFGNDTWFLGILLVGVFLGSIGFPVIFALKRHLTRPRQWSLHVKLTLATTVILLVVGAVGIVALEFNNPKTFGTMNAGDTVFQSLFLSMMARSGGFSTIDISELNGSSHLVLDMLMFVGGGSASTAGGIKVTTLAVLVLAAFAEARGRQEISAFGRRVPSDVIRVAISVFFWAATIVAVSCILLMQITHEPLDRVLFDVISGFGTVGLSTGLTDELPDAGKYVLALTMFMGRVGTVTLAAAVASTSNGRLYRHPEERPIVG